MSGTRARRHGLWLACATCLALASCDTDKVLATQVVVSVNADLVLREALQRIDVEITPLEGGPAVSGLQFWLSKSEPKLDGQVALPFSFGVGRGKSDRFRMVVRGQAPSKDGQLGEVIRHTVISGFEPHRKLLLKVFLGAACLGQLCADQGTVQATCYADSQDGVAAGQCGPVRDERGLMPIVPGSEDDSWAELDASNSHVTAPAEDATIEAPMTDAGGPQNATPDAASAREDAAASADDAGRTQADAGPVVRDAGRAEAGPPAAPPPVPVELTLPIARDADDGTWIKARATGVQEERLHYDDRANGAGKHIEVANDNEQGRAGLRFVLPIEPGATVQSATLTLQRFTNADFVADAASASAAMRVQVFESSRMPPFDATHRHTAEQHAPVWSQAVGGYKVGAFGALVVSPELRELVQHVIDRPDYERGGAIGFLLSPETIPSTKYADFTDQSAGHDVPTLRVRYLPPR
jgi:hypothetical protein